MAQTNMLAAIRSAVFLAASISLGAAQTLDVNVGFAATIKMERKVDRVTISDPDVVIASIVDGKIIVIVGKSTGLTHITPLDREGNEITDILVKVVPYPSDDYLIDITYNT